MHESDLSKPNSFISRIEFRIPNEPNWMLLQYYTGKLEFS